jgi:hypothetical protein
MVLNLTAELTQAALQDSRTKSVAALFLLLD